MSRKFTNPPNLNAVLWVLIICMFLLQIYFVTGCSPSLASLQEDCAERGENCAEAMRKEDIKRRREDRTAAMEALRQACLEQDTVLYCDVRGPASIARDVEGDCYCVDRGALRNGMIW